MPKILRGLETTSEYAYAPERAKWLAAYTATHHEKRVLEQLTEHHVESYLPLYRAARQWKKRSAVTLELPLFPNYVFVRIANAQRTAVLGTPGIYSIVGSAKRAWELPEREIETLRTGLQERKVEPHSYLSVGERARITSGVLAGLEGIVIRQKHNLRFVLSMDQIMQSIVIEVDAGELEPITSAAAQGGHAPLVNSLGQFSPAWSSIH